MEDISEKQNYLYREVIEAGYNPEAFQEFIIAQNPKKGMDLSKWSMNQLKSVTNKFRTQVDKQKVQVQASEIKEDKQQQSPTKKPQTIILNSKQQQYYKKIECYKIKGEVVPEDTVAVIDSFQKKEGGMFESSYVVYQVKTDKLKSCVMRRYSDFQWLKQSFQVFYPGMPIPPIAKKGKLKRKDDKHLYKRMYILQKFLNRVIQIPQLRASILLHKFLTLKDMKDLENQKIKTKKLKNVPIEKLQNIAGQLQFKIDSPTNGYISKTHKYLQTIQPEVKKIYKDFKGSATMLEGCAAYMSNLATNCNILSKNLINYRKQCELPQKKNNLFSCLSEMTGRFSQLMMQQAKVFRKQMYAMIKYESFCMLGMIQSLDKLAQMQNTFIEHKNELYKKKQKLFYEGNLSKWGTLQKITVKPERDEAFEIMLPRQTKQLLRQRDMYALYNYQAYKQLQRSMRQNDNKLSKYFDQVLKLLSSISSKSIMIWADILISANDITILSNVPPIT